MWLITEWMKWWGLSLILRVKTVDLPPSEGLKIMWLLKKNTLSCSDQNVMENRSNPNAEHLESRSESSVHQSAATSDTTTVAGAFNRGCVCVSGCVCVLISSQWQWEITGFRDLTGIKTTWMQQAHKHEKNMVTATETRAENTIYLF